MLCSEAGQLNHVGLVLRGRAFSSAMAECIMAWRIEVLGMDRPKHHVVSGDASHGVGTCDLKDPRTCRTCLEG